MGREPVAHAGDPAAAAGATSATPDSLLRTVSRTAIELASLGPEADLGAFLVRRLKELTGAAVTTLGTYDPEGRVIVIRQLVSDSALLRLLRKLHFMPESVRSPVDEDAYREMISSRVGYRRTLTEISFGAVPAPVSSMLQRALGIDRFAAISYVFRGRLYGTSVLALKSAQPDPPRDLLESFGALGAMALQTQIAEGESTRKASRLAILNEIIAAGSRSTTLSGLLEEACEAILRHLGFDASGAYLVDEGGKTASVVFSRGIPESFLSRVRTVSTDRPNQLRVLVRGDPLFTSDYNRLDERAPPLPGFVSLASIPLVGTSRVIGALNLASRRQHDFDEEEQALLVSAGRELGGLVERFRAEQALQQSEARYRFLFDHAQDGICVAQDGVIQAANARLRAMVGRDDEARRTPLNELIHPDDAPEVLRRHRERLRGTPGIPSSSEFRVLRSDGTSLRVEVDTVLAEWDGRPATLNVLRDVTERRRTEELLRQSEDKFTKLFQAAPTLIVITRLRDGMILDANPAFEAVTGYALTEVIGRTVIELELWHHREQRRKMVDELRERGEVLNQQIRFRHKDGSIRSGVFFARSLRIDDEECLVFQLHDETERRRAEEQRAKLEEQLREAQRMDAVGRLAGGVAHDFNNLLTVIRGTTSLLLDGGTAGPELRADLREILDAAERAQALTAQLLAFGRRQVMKPALLDLNELIQNALRMLRRIIGEDITLEFDPSSGIGAVRADRGHLEQVLMNLCTNARDAMPLGGELTIATASVLLDERDLAVEGQSAQGRYVLLTVSDTGQGMDQETLARAFEPFYTTKQVGRGTGLGLAVVYGIVKQHGGLAHVWSSPGKGTRVAVYLPEAEGRATVVSSAQTVPTAAGGSETVLVVEDEELVQRVTIRILEQAGYTVLRASNGDQALEVAARHPGVIDLAIVDVVMPGGLSGADVRDRLLALRPSLRVLFCSGYSRNSIHTRYVLHDSVELLQKPFSPGELLSKVRRILDASPAQ